MHTLYVPDPSQEHVILWMTFSMFKYYLFLYCILIWPIIIKFENHHIYGAFYNISQCVSTCPCLKTSRQPVDVCYLYSFRWLTHRQLYFISFFYIYRYNMALVSPSVYFMLRINDQSLVKFLNYEQKNTFSSMGTAKE